MSKVLLKNENGLVKEVKVGFSWTTFFFGGFVAMFRGQWSEVAKWFFLNPITLGFWGLAQCWTGNKKMVVELMEKGYKPASEHDASVLATKGIIG